MRIHYYRFPDDISADVRAEHGADTISNTCRVRPEHYDNPDNDRPSKGCPQFDGSIGCIDCSNLVCVEAEDTISGISITRAKALLKKFGGSAWTSHIDRDGGVFETTAIELKGNNSRHKYNQHL